MNIVVLTTLTTHHIYIVKELNKYFPINHVMLEEKVVVPKFDISHPYLKLQDQYETDLFFSGTCPKLEELVSLSSYDDLNSSLAINKLKSLNPDLVIVAGTGKLSPKFISTCSNRIINLHGGDSQKYRGLDSMLWSIYHNDFESLLVTLHLVREKLDTGEIIQQCKINLSKNMKLHQLRAENVIVCVKLLVSAINSLKSLNQLLLRPQISKGRYYSFMPSALKEVCRMKFEKYASKLDDYR